MKLNVVRNSDCIRLLPNGTLDLSFEGSSMSDIGDKNKLLNAICKFNSNVHSVRQPTYWLTDSKSQNNRSFRLPFLSGNIMKLYNNRKRS